MNDHNKFMYQKGLFHANDEINSKNKTHNTLYLVLTTNVPDSEADILVFHSLHIEPFAKMEMSLICQTEKMTMSRSII